MNLHVLSNPILLAGIILVTLGFGNRTVTIVVGVILAILGLLVL